MRYVPGQDRYHVKKRECAKITPRGSRPRFFESDSAQWFRKGVVPRRDSYRQRFYDVENYFVESLEPSSFTNIYDIAIFVRSFMERNWFQRRFPRFSECVVEHKTQGGWSLGGPKMSIGNEVVSGSIRISTNHMKHGKWLVLHELAHAVLPEQHDHDRRWVRTYLEFIGVVYGQDSKRLFQKLLRGGSVPFNPIRDVDPVHLYSAKT